MTYADYACLPESKLGYFTTSFVRNPYDRVYSGFQQLQIAVKNQPLLNHPKPWIRNLVTAQLAEVYTQLCASQFIFDTWLDSISDEQIYEIGRNTTFPLHPANYWSHIAGQQMVDFIGRVENFEEDFKILLQHIGIELESTSNVNVIDLEGNAAYNPYGYRYTDRMSECSIKKINRLFESDFNLFDYNQIES
jgi:hypothetical protein